MFMGIVKIKVPGPAQIRLDRDKNGKREQEPDKITVKVTEKDLLQLPISTDIMFYQTRTHIIS